MTDPRATHILLVEDDPDDIELTIMAFEDHRIANRVDVARDGAEALTYLLGDGERPPETDRPALILLDINLPKMDGLEVLKALREAERTRYLPVVMLTSSRHQEDLLKSYDLGANSFIRKPVDFGKFVEAMRNLQIYWLVFNETP